MKALIDLTIPLIILSVFLGALLCITIAIFIQLRQLHQQCYATLLMVSQLIYLTNEAQKVMNNAVQPSNEKGVENLYR